MHLPLPPELLASGFGEPCMAIEPSAVRGFTPSTDRRAVSRVGGVAVVRVEGPLARNASYYDGYDAIVQRIGDALASDARAVMIVAHSPGGYVSGLDEAVTKIAALKAQSGKRIEMVSADMAYSAMYYLGTVADSVSVLRSGGVGSVGTILDLLDFSKFYADMGIRWLPIASGEQKTDGHPGVPLTEEVIGRFRDRIGFYSQMFFERVATARGMTVEQVRGQQAAIYLGEAAVSAGLADAVVSTVDEAIAALDKKTSGRAQVFASQAGQSAQKAAHAGHTKGSDMEMSMLILALGGLAAGATDQDVVQRASALRDVEGKLRDVTGKASASEALAVVGAWQESSGKLAEANAELGKLRAKDVEREIARLVGEGEASGKIVPANRAKVLANYGTDPAALSAWLETAMPSVPGASGAADKPARNNETKGSGGNGAALTWNGKAWKDLSFSERAQLHTEDKALYEQMKGGA